MIHTTLHPLLLLQISVIYHPPSILCLRSFKYRNQLEIDTWHRLRSLANRKNGKSDDSRPAENLRRFSRPAPNSLPLTPKTTELIQVFLAGSSS